MPMRIMILAMIFRHKEKGRSEMTFYSFLLCHCHLLTYQTPEASRGLTGTGGTG